MKKGAGEQVERAQEGILGWDVDAPQFGSGTLNPSMLGYMQG
jgi:hypothetical protein